MIGDCIVAGSDSVPEGLSDYSKLFVLWAFPKSFSRNSSDSATLAKIPWERGIVRKL